MIICEVCYGMDLCKLLYSFRVLLCSYFMPIKICSCKATYNDFFVFHPASPTFYLWKRGVCYLHFICPNLTASSWCHTGSKELLALDLFSFCSVPNKRSLVLPLRRYLLVCRSLIWDVHAASGEVLVPSHTIIWVLPHLGGFAHYFVVELNMTLIFDDRVCVSVFLVLLVSWQEEESDMFIYYFKTESLPTSFKWLLSIALYGYMKIY